MSKKECIRKNAKYIVIFVAIGLFFCCLALGFLMGGFVHFLLGR